MELQLSSPSQEPGWRVRLVALAVAIHVVLSLSHGVAHVTIPVQILLWQGVFVGVVLVTLPLVGVGFLATDSPSIGYWIILLAGLAGFAFEGSFHFVITNPDHVSSVVTEPVLFTSTAFLTTASDLVLVAIAGWALRQ